MAQPGKKTIEELKRDQRTQALDPKAMDRVTGGRRRGHWFRQVCGGIMPQ